MKILIFAGYFYPHKGGLENHIYEFSEKMSERGHKITILTANTENVKEYEVVNPNFDIYRIPAINALNGTYPIPIPNIKLLKIWAKLKKNNYDIIMTRTRFFLTSFLGNIFAKLNQIKLIHVEHGSCHTVTDNPLVSLAGMLYDHTLGFILVKSAKQNIGISIEASKFLEHLGANNLEVIYRGINGVGKLKKANKKIKSIIYVGRLILAKGVQDLILAFSQLKNKNLTLTIVGKGPYKKDLEQLAKRYKISSQVKFLGEKDKEQVFQLLSNSDLFINPSYSEGLPTSVLEAGSIGLPVIATDVGGTREVIIPNKTGILIKEKSPNQIKEAIEFFIHNKDKAKLYSHNLNKLVKKSFNWEENIKKWEKLLERN